MKVSIITITFQCEKYINRCYYSILAQTFENWEWVVVDDGSIDNTRNKIEGFKDDRIKYFYLNPNQGRGRARNFALDKVSGDWCVILDMDDLMDPIRLQCVMEADLEGFDYLVSSTRLIDDSYNTTGIRSIFYNQNLRIFTHATLCIKTKNLKAIRYSDTRYAEDQRVILLATTNNNGKYVNIPLYIYHENASVNLRGAMLSNLAAFKSLIDILFKERSRKVEISILVYAFSFACKYFMLNVFRFTPSLYKLTYSFRSRTVGNTNYNHPEGEEFMLDLKERFLA
jgi:glycosyltransferase involved in cell wall biosynthesis